ncbi:MAG: Asp-tRNA(Asn)/Glu-tRNA(Gln) amidotransferase GatCAB subunit C, partial [Erysipelotrichaceae bacterium]|nr:Asp-tRNA(Asn)/Glu-tRNA(Gln) amidotransferase GatCAB subunit C [Erysipelotrichaceae bacterium]
MLRTHNNGELRLSDVGKTVTLIGWVAKKRNLGALVFVDLRDRYGLTQIIFDESFDAALREVKNEYILSVTGTVVERSSKNPKMPTGEIEIEAKEFTVVNKADVPPIIVADETDASEEVRMQYRYLDLRRSVLQKNMMTR